MTLVPERSALPWRQETEKTQLAMALTFFFLFFAFFDPAIFDVTDPAVGKALFATLLLLSLPLHMLVRHINEIKVVLSPFNAASKSSRYVNDHAYQMSKRQHPQQSGTDYF